MNSYATLGLASTLNPRAKGGSETAPLAGSTGASQDRPCSSSINGANNVPKGFGRIIRDATGSVVDVELGEERIELMTEEGDEMVRGQQIQTWSGQGTRDSESTALVKGMTKSPLPFLL